MRYAALAILILLSNSSQARNLSIDDIYHGAESEIEMSKNVDLSNREKLARAFEFRGYVSGLLDGNRFLSENPDEHLSDCGDIEDHNRLILEIALLLESQPLSIYPKQSPALTLGLTMYEVCQEATKAGIA